MFDKLLWSAFYFLCCDGIYSTEAISCGNQTIATLGKYLKLQNRKFHIEQPFQNFSATRIGTCATLFSGESEAQSMNVIRESQTKVQCQFMRVKAQHASSLITKSNSKYYEKYENYVKATASSIDVEAADDKPGTFIFKLPTGSYRIKLNHLSGGLINDGNPANIMPFGAVYLGKYNANKMMLLRDIRGETVLEKEDFTDWQGNGSKTSFVGTSECFLLIGNSTYSFWYGSDLSNHIEHDNSGKTTFEMVVEFCDHCNGGA